jgi:hypothetical protein
MKVNKYRIIMVPGGWEVEMHVCNIIWVGWWITIGPTTNYELAENLYKVLSGGKIKK